MNKTFVPEGYRPQLDAYQTQRAIEYVKRTFQNDTTENRLARLENKIFGKEFIEDDEQTRISRISSAYKAQKNSSKYDSNKFARNMTTAMQIGTILLMMLACIL